ncbi:hypothetical protein SRIMHP_05645 [Streptomyces rimosus subsp. rimosus]|uniref:Uncharacterized protein n=1 Tax=Streptomyces rimosus subsp. rimosus TaxID=132474 RepID=A0ABY3ZBL8_STRRM|nr:hypothetical protein SRIMR7_36730 [Streptomyces rimosus subsp. rimosus]UTH93601.1 hypothetical protein SRIMHP_05645 [Streptomyces rimosus subsp. rimosus]UTJ11696.1 hypothetical protein SRIMDV3_05540 [Streptomyces rimosus subsp. rimosus]
MHLTEPFGDLDPVPVTGCATCEDKAEERREALDKGFIAVAALAANVIGRHPRGHRRKAG